MFITGIYKPSQLATSRRSNVLGKKRRVSIELLAADTTQCDDAELRELVMLEFTDDRGAYKRTYRSRHRAFDQIALDVLASEMSGTQGGLTVHDVAVSSGLGAVEFFHDLDARFSLATFIASDYDPFVSIVKRRCYSVAFSSRKVPLQVTCPPFVISLMRKDSAWLYPVNYLVRKIFQSWIIPRMTSSAGAFVDGADIVAVDLFSKEARRLARNDSRFVLRDYDLLATTGELRDVDCIRAMNVLNSTYFDPSQLALVLRSILAQLRENGIFICGSNQDVGTEVDGAIYKKVDGKFQLLKSTVERPKIDAHITELNNRSSGARTGVTRNQ
jgi:hypothetical protein